jgi:hypothetical protein
VTKRLVILLALVAALFCASTVSVTKANAYVPGVHYCNTPWVALASGQQFTACGNDYWSSVSWSGAPSCPACGSYPLFLWIQYYSSIIRQDVRGGSFSGVTLSTNGYRNVQVYNGSGSQWLVAVNAHT